MVTSPGHETYINQTVVSSGNSIGWSGSESSSCSPPSPTPINMLENSVPYKFGNYANYFFRE